VQLPAQRDVGGRVSLKCDRVLRQGVALMEEVPQLQSPCHHHPRHLGSSPSCQGTQCFPLSQVYVYSQSQQTKGAVVDLVEGAVPRMLGHNVARQTALGQVRFSPL
jgi:hypothetical protein